MYKNILTLAFLSLLISACGDEKEPDLNNKKTKTTVKNEIESKVNTKVEELLPPKYQSEVEEIEAQIIRIKEKLKTEPKAKGWILIGDAYMYLKRYDEAVSAYGEAYKLEETHEIRNKLKAALYEAGQTMRPKI